MKLYEIVEQFKGLNELVEAGEFSAEDVANTLEAIDATFSEKVKNCLFVRQQKQAESAAIDREIKRLQALKVSSDKDEQSILDYIKGSMIAKGDDKLDLGLFKLTLRKPVQKLGDIDEEKVPDEFWQVIPASKKLDKRALLKSAKESAIDGVTIVDGDRSLMVK